MTMIVAPDQAGFRHKSRQSCRNTGQVFAFATIRLRRHQNVSLGRCGFRMLRFLTVFALLVIGLPAAAQEGRNDFPRIIPQEWTLLPPKSNEWRAVSPRRDAWLSLYATPIKGSVSSHLRAWGVNAGDRVTYQRQGRGWIVVSGYTAEDRIFYRKMMLACEGRKWHNLAFEYPASDKRAMDEFVTRASYALAAYNQAGC